MKTLIRATLWAAFLYVLILLAALALAPDARSEEARVTVVYLQSEDQPAVKGWAAVYARMPSGVVYSPATGESHIPVISKAHGAGCSESGGVQQAIWLASHWQGFTILEWRCIAPDELDAFFEKARAAGESLPDTIGGR